MSNPIESALAQCNVPGGTSEPLIRLWKNGFQLSDDDYEMIVARLSLNHGKPPSPKTGEKHRYLARFLVAYWARKKIEGRDLKATIRALEAVLPQFPNIPNDPDLLKPENINNPGSLARRIVEGRRPEITKLAKGILANESKGLGNDTNGRNS